MRTWPDCAPCILRMNLEVIRSMTDDAARVAELMDAVLRVFNGEMGRPGATAEEAADEALDAPAPAPAPASAPEAAPARRAPEIIAAIWREVVRLTGDADPMRTVKARQDS